MRISGKQCGCSDDITMKDIDLGLKEVKAQRDKQNIYKDRENLLKIAGKLSQYVNAVEDIQKIINSLK